MTVATGHGKKAARHIDAWLRGSEYRPAAKHPVGRLRRSCNLPIYSDAERSQQSELPVSSARTVLTRSSAA